MAEVPGTIQVARRSTLTVANSLIMAASGAVDAGNVEYADTIVITVMRVLDAYEAVTQLGIEQPHPAPAKPLYRVGPREVPDA